MTGTLWRAAQLSDIDLMLELTQQHYLVELNSVLTINLTKLAHRLAHSIIDQNFNHTHQIQTVWQNNRLIAWSWLSRGTSTDYIDEEVAEAHMLHIDLNLRPRHRIQLVNQILDQWIAWCKILKIPVLASTTVRSEWQTFMELHRRRGFVVHGSHAFYDIRKEI